MTMTLCRVLERPVMFAVVAKRLEAVADGTRAVSIGVGGEPAKAGAVGIAARTLAGSGVGMPVVMLSSASIASRNATAFSKRRSRFFSRPRSTT